MKNSYYYKYGLNPKKVYKKHVLPEISTLIDHLKIPEDKIFKLFKAFIKINHLDPTNISLKEYHNFFKIKFTLFNGRMFLNLMMIDDTRLTDIASMEKINLDFKDFLIGTWRFCTWDMEDIISVRCFTALLN